VKDYDAINTIYKKLQDDKAQADISKIIKEMHAIIDDSIVPYEVPTTKDKDKIYDISAIDFEKLKEEFQKSPKKNTTVQCLKDYIDNKLAKMLDKNPLRIDFNKRYQEIVSEYNFEKDRITIEKTFEELMRFVRDLDDEEKRAVREGLDEEYLALFDLLSKPDLKQQSRTRIKKVAIDLLDALKKEKLRIDHWREKETTCAEVKSFIHDFLWDESCGLPTDCFSNDEVEAKSSAVFDHIYRQYEDAVKNKYAA
jgi:type I restriction enzyme R subunit